MMRPDGFDKWSRVKVRWFRFWDPRSGAVGGLIISLLVITICGSVFALMKLIQWMPL